MHPFSTGSFARFIRSPEPPPEAPSAHRPRDSSSTARRLGQGRRSRRAKRGNPLRSRAPCYPGDGDGQTAPLAMMALRVLVELSHPESVSFHPQILRKSLFFYQLHLSRWDKQNPGKSSPNKQDVGRYVPLLSELKVSLEKKLMVKSEEQPKPIAQSKPTSEPTPAEQVKPAIQPEQVEPSRPPVQPKPLELPSSGKSQIGRSTLWLVSGIATAADLSGQAAGGLDAPEPDGGYLGFQ